MHTGSTCACSQDLTGGVDGGHQTDAYDLQPKNTVNTNCMVMIIIVIIRYE